MREQKVLRKDRTVRNSPFNRFRVVALACVWSAVLGPDQRTEKLEELHRRRPQMMGKKAH